MTEHESELVTSTEIPVDYPEPESEAPHHDPDLETQLDQFAVLYPFPLDDFQKEAIRTFLEGDSVMVAAPTGSGKTIVAEFGMYQAFKRTGRVFYTSPIKALSNQKFRDLRVRYGDEVGLLTGDITENRDARILVMTTEILRNMLLQSPWELDDVDCVIFDEVHYLADPERGTTWEESIILCPEHVQLICLSATVTNASEIAGWIGRTHRPIRLISHNERPVPLALYYFHDDQLDQVVDHHGRQVKDFPQKGGELRAPAHRGRRRGDRSHLVFEEPQAREIIESLAGQDMLPAIYFLFSRNDCQAYAERLAFMVPDLASNSEQIAIDAVIDSYRESLRPEDLELEQVRLVTNLARHGIGFHHAGLLPLLKQLVEVLFSRGLMKVVFATDTLALGVNMPARTVVVGRMMKWDGTRRRVLIPNEFQQMAGRAGRRGMDVFGHVVMPYSPIIPFREMLDLATGPLHPVRSAFSIRYNTVLNLWDPPQGERVRQMLQRSLAQYQANARIRIIEDDILDIEAELAGLEPASDADLDALYEEYQAILQHVQSSQHKIRKLETDRENLRRGVSSGRPWTVPSSPVLKRLFRDEHSGTVVHSDQHGWGVFLVRPAAQGVAVIAFPPLNVLQTITQYREIDNVHEDERVRVPDSLVQAALDGATEIEPELLRELSESLAALQLPDLQQRAREWRAEEERQIAEAEDQITAQVAEARETLRSQSDERNEHTFHDNNLRKQHSRSVRQRDALHKERNGLVELLDREIRAEEIRVRRIIHGIREVLHRFEYMKRGYPTEKADMLADIFDNDGLILCEMIVREMLNDLEPEELAEVFSWFCFDREFRYQNHFTLSNRLINVRKDLESLQREILGEERDLDLFISEGHNPNFYGAALHWCRGWSMADIGEQLELSEGDLVITFNKTIDLMRQVRDMLLNVLPDHTLRYSLTQAERMLRRGIVEQSLTLGITPLADEADEEDDAADDE